jgi:hypothetical protein
VQDQSGRAGFSLAIDELCQTILLNLNKRLEMDICPFDTVGLDGGGLKNGKRCRVRYRTNARVLSVIFAAGVGENRHVHAQQPKDRRIQKTQDLLRAALAALIHDKAYDFLHALPRQERPADQWPA